MTSGTSPDKMIVATTKIFAGERHQPTNTISWDWLGAFCTSLPCRASLARWRGVSAQLTLVAERRIPSLEDTGEGGRAVSKHPTAGSGPRWVSLPGGDGGEPFQPSPLQATAG